MVWEGSTGGVGRDLLVAESLGISLAGHEEEGSPWEVKVGA